MATKRALKLRVKRAKALLDEIIVRVVAGEDTGPDEFQAILKAHHHLDGDYDPPSRREMRRIDRERERERLLH